MKLFLNILFLTILFLHVALVKFTVGLPVRTILMIAFAGLVFLVYNKQFLRVILKFRYVYYIIIAVSLVGLSISLLNGVETFKIIEYMVRNSIQPVLVFFVISVCIDIFGFKYVTKAILFFAIVSIVVAIGQFFQVGLAWKIRETLEILQDSPRAVVGYIERQSRPMGLLLTPIMFSYHIASAYVIANLLYRHGYMQPRAYIVFTILALAGAVACGTRSLVMGLLLHESLQLALRRQFKAFLWLGIIGAFALGGFFYLQTIGSRVASVDDASAAVRLPLLQYGVTLFLHNPYGLRLGRETGGLCLVILGTDSASAES